MSAVCFFVLILNNAPALRAGNEYKRAGLSDPKKKAPPLSPRDESGLLFAARLRDRALCIEPDVTRRVARKPNSLFGTHEHTHFVEL